MGYSALEKMQEWNEKNYNVKKRPDIPELSSGKENTLRWCALTFLREDCQGLRFDPAAGGVARTKRDRSNVVAVKDNIGKSYCKNQIPYHMQMDLDRLCLERTLGDFLEMGTAQKAYLVFFCYLEMYWGKDSAQPRGMIELLSAFEQNASTLLYSHRDHFVHSVYVFAMGLAIYQQSEVYRKKYMDRNGFQPAQRREAAHHFLKYWGFTALLHDLGYPFEVAYCQINDYYKKQSIPSFYISYLKGKKGPANSLEESYAPLYQALFRSTVPVDPDPSKKRLLRFTSRLLTRARARVNKTTPKPSEIAVNDVFADALTQRLYQSHHECPDYEEYREKEHRYDTEDTYSAYLKACLDGKLSDPEHMDHAYFSAYLLLHQLWNPGQKKYPTDYLDALTAILLHNSLFKYTIMKDVQIRTDYPKMSIDVHPLAFLLMLCDELQCWNRFGYGKKTKTENHPIDCELTFKDNQITAKYIFDQRFETDPINKKTGTYRKFCGSSSPYPFEEELGKLLALNIMSTDDASLTLNVETPAFRGCAEQRDTLSHSSFLDLFRIATLINAEYRTRDETYTEYHETEARSEITFTEQKRMEYFDQLSLEYKLSNLYQVQRYAENLEKNGMFFTDRPVAYQKAEIFNKEILEKIGKQKHDDWAKEKEAMGWRHGKDYHASDLLDTEVNDRRERLREHQYIDCPFDQLSEADKVKDTNPIKQQREYMERYFDIYVYKLPETKQPSAPAPADGAPAADPAPAAVS